MRYVSVNSVPHGSTGAVMRQITDERRALGDECWTMWGRGRDAENEHEFNYGNRMGVCLDALQTRLDGRAGFHSKGATKRLIEKLNDIQPNVVHLHNLHGYHVNVDMLFGWLALHSEVRVKWTLHDCWAFTGHCAYFTYVGCERWRDGTCGKRCPQLNTYPKTLSRSSCRWDFERKREVFTKLPPSRMMIVTPSHWLKGLVKQSFLAKYSVEVRHNVVDREIFKPTLSDFRERFGIGNRFMVLGVASPWTERKGLDDFVRLAQDLDQSQYAIVLIGLSRRQKKKLPHGIIGLERTNSLQNLAAVYTAADVFFNPTREDNFPTVNMEAEACGTTVITYDTGGCKETVKSSESRVVEANYEDAFPALVLLAHRKFLC